MDFERSEASLREDMAEKNEYFMQQYKNYNRFIGNPGKGYRKKNKEKEEKERDEKEEDEVEDKGVHVN